MTLIATLDLDDQTPNAAVSVSDPWYLSSGGSETITALAAAAVHGSLGGRISSASSYRGVYYRESQTTATRVIDFYVTPSAVPANAYVMALLDGTTNRADVRINAAGTVAIRNAFVAVATSTETLTLNGTVTYRFAWKISTTGQELRVYVGEGSTPLITLTGALTDATHTDIGAGLTTASAGFSADFDTIRVADDWLAPFGAAEEPLETPTNFTFAASSTPGVAEITADADPVTGAGAYEIEVEHRISGQWEPLDTFTTETLPLVLDGDDGIVVARNYRGRIRALPGA